MDIRSEQKSQYRAYSDEVVSRARPPMIKKPNNLHLTGNIELFPEYKSKFIPYSLDSINKSNKIPCYHPKRERRERKVEENNDNDMADMRKAQEAKVLNNNYGVSCMNRYHEKLDYENNNYVPEYRSKYRPVVGERSTIIPQQSHFQRHNDEFNSTSEYNNRYKNYDHFTKSAPIKKQDNLYMRGQTQMQPEYKDRYREIDYKSFSRQPACRQQDNLYSDGKFPSQVPEYSEKYKSHHAHVPERSKGREDFLHLNGDMEYDVEYRNNYVEFPRQRPIVIKPKTHIKLSSTNERTERKPDNFNLPISLPYHDPSSAHYGNIDDGDVIPLESTPEYRKAMKNYLIKERSPSRGPPDIEVEKKANDKTNKVVDHNDVTKILTENKVNVPEEKIFNENNEVIVDPIKGPTNFKIPTRSPTNLSLGRAPTYPIGNNNKFSEHLSVSRKPRKVDVSFDLENRNARMNSRDYDSFDDNENLQEPAPRYYPERVEYYEQHQERPKKSPKFGRRAPNPREDYHVRKKTNVIEGNAAYGRDYRPNRHEQKAYQIKTEAQPFAVKPADSLENNYQPNYEINKQQSYRQSLNNNEPFVVLDREIANKVKQSSWMKKQWYDTN